MEDASFGVGSHALSVASQSALPCARLPGMNPAWTVAKVSERAELEQILALQRANLAVNVSLDEAQAQGFVTAVHSLETLQQMHELAPSIVAPSDSELAGYALTMRVEARAVVPILEPMFELLETLSWHGRPLRDLPFYVMGQVCVAKIIAAKSAVPEQLS